MWSGEMTIVLCVCVWGGGGYGWSLNEFCIYFGIFGNNICLNLYLILIETPFNTFAKRADPDQTALVGVA